MKSILGYSESSAGFFNPHERAAFRAGAFLVANYDTEDEVWRPVSPQSRLPQGTPNMFSHQADEAGATGRRMTDDEIKAAEHTDETMAAETADSYVEEFGEDIRRFAGEKAAETMITVDLPSSPEAVLAGA